MNAMRLRQALGHAVGRHGMLIVLAGLCLYYSAVTVSDQAPTTEAAARQVAEQVPRGGRAVLIGTTKPEDEAWAAAVEAALGERGVALVAKALGEPRDARLAFEAAVAAGGRVNGIVTTAECAAWTVVSGAATRFPELGRPRVVVPGSVRWPTFLTRQNLLNIANQITVVAVLAAGMTVVIVAGGIDLSVGSLIALSAVVATLFVRDYGGGTTAGPVAMLAGGALGVGVCGVIGLGSGAMVVWFRIPPFIATLAVMQVASGLAFIAAKGGSIYEVPDSFAWLGRSVGWFGVPTAVWLMGVLYGATHVLMTRTVLGRHVYAVGGNAEAARCSGVKVGRVLLFAYAFCGAMAGLGGVLQASQLKSGAPTYGVMYELYAIAAVVVGGASLSGGVGRVFGTLTGAFIIAVIQNGMNLTGVESYRQKVVLGLVILGAVWLDLLKRRDWAGWWRRWRG